jgi:hypothetical protein
MSQKNGGKTEDKWSSPTGDNGGGIAAKSGGVGEAPVSQHGREVEGVKETLLHALAR